MEKKKILAVDDNAVNLAAIEQTLQDEYEIIPMVAGKRAIKYLGVEKVDLILLDVQMPDMDGIRTLEEIRKLDNGWTVPVIFLTATSDSDVSAAGARLGIMDYITKPFDSTDLKKRIEDAFQKISAK